MHKILAGFAAFMAFFLFFGGDVFAVTISGNGSGTHNSVYVTSSAFSLVAQTNSASFYNGIKTGGKSWKGTQISFNTGGSVGVIGGDVTNTVNVNNVANTNTNTLSDPCCLCGQPGSVTISGNGDHSFNSVMTSTKCVTKVEQVNVANITNSIDVSGSTGGVDVAHNTNTDVTVSSGDSSTSVTVNNVANTNTSM